MAWGGSASELAASNYTYEMISVKGLVKRFDARVVLEGIDLEVQKGEILAIMGTSGGGKTTLLRCIAGLLRPESGSVLVDSIDIHKEPDLARPKLGMVFQSSALFDYLSVRDNVSFGLKRQRGKAKAAIEDIVGSMLGVVGLSDSEELLPGELSGGMKKRVGIARALAMQPEVMLYDEPITGLDPVTAYTIDRLIMNVRKRFDMTSILVSHDVSSVFRIADRIAFLHQGKLEFIGRPAEFEGSSFPAIAELLQKARSTSIL